MFYIRLLGEFTVFINPLSAGDAFKRIHTVFPQLKFDIYACINLE